MFWTKDVFSIVLIANKLKQNTKEEEDRSLAGNLVLKENYLGIYINHILEILEWRDLTLEILRMLQFVVYDFFNCM